MIGGNTIAWIQTKQLSKNAIGERTDSWENAGSIEGFLDFSPAVDPSTVNVHKAKVQDTTHLFLCDYEEWMGLDNPENIRSENARLVHEDAVYQILLIDDPMSMHEHLEIYLRYTGGGLGASSI